MSRKNRAEVIPQQESPSAPRGFRARACRLAQRLPMLLGATRLGDYGHPTPPAFAARASCARYSCCKVRNAWRRFIVPLRTFSVPQNPLKCHHSRFAGNGGRRPGKYELNEPIAVVLDYGEKWIIRKRIDPVELVTLRKSGLTCEEIATRFGVAKSTVSRNLLISS